MVGNFAIFQNPMAVCWPDVARAVKENLIQNIQNFIYMKDSKFHVYEIWILCTLSGKRSVRNRN